MNAPGFNLQRFEPRFAANVVSWVRNARELFWLAPRTAYPLTPAKIVGWTRDCGTAFLLSTDDDPEPCAYGELNASRRNPLNMWLGHLLVDTHHRQKGVGRQLTRLLVDEAFRRCGAEQLALVVFPDNLPAIRCYMNCGFRLRGEEHQCLGTGRDRHRLLRFEMNARELAELEDTPRRKSCSPVG